MNKQVASAALVAAILASGCGSSPLAATAGTTSANAAGAPDQAAKVAATRLSLLTTEVDELCPDPTTGTGTGGTGTGGTGTGGTGTGGTGTGGTGTGGTGTGGTGKGGTGTGGTGKGGKD